MISIVRKTIRAKKFNKSEEIKSGSWLNITHATQQDLETIAELSGLEFSDVKDALDDHEIPRIERHEKSVIIFTRTPTSINESPLTDTLTIIATKKFTATISKTENSIIQQILEQNPKVATTQQTKFMLFLLLRIAQAYTFKIKTINDLVARQKKALQEVSSADILALTRNEDVLNQYLSSLIPLRNVFNTILSGGHVDLYEEDSDLFEDLLISIRQSVDVCTVNLKSIRSLRDAYQITFTNDLNRTMKFLASFTILLTIPTIISSMYGMNVNLPLDAHPGAFFILLAIMLAISSLVLYIFNLKKWL